MDIDCKVGTAQICAALLMFDLGHTYSPCLVKLANFILWAGKHPCVVRGQLLEKSTESISVSVDHRLQSFLLQDGSNSWRLDKDEISSNFVRMRQNVMCESAVYQRDQMNPCIYIHVEARGFMGGASYQSYS